MISTLKSSTKPMKRSPISRIKPLSGILRTANLPAPKTKKCAVCRNPFVPSPKAAKVCGPECAESFVNSEKLKAERRADKARLQELKPLHYWAKRAEKACNTYIRLRDAGDPCISCGTYDSPIWHAGHLYTVKARSDIRYHEDNIHLQCPDCNTFNGGMVGDYKVRVVSKIGQERLDALAFVNPAAKKTREYYQSVEAHYIAKLKALQANKFEEAA